MQISKWYSEAVNLRANNTMDKRKKKDRNTTQKAQDRTTRTPLITGSELGGPGMHETLTIGRMITKMKILDLVHTIRFWNNIHQVHSE